MQALLKPSQTLSKSKTEHARLDTPAAASVCETTIIHRLNAFTEERETCIGSADGTEEVRAFVESFAQSEGYERTCELLDLAAMYKDYDRVDYEVYRELIATPSAANVIETGALQLLSPFPVPEHNAGDLFD